MLSSDSSTNLIKFDSLYERWLVWPGAFCQIAVVIIRKHARERLSTCCALAVLTVCLCFVVVRGSVVLNVDCYGFLRFCDSVTSVRPSV